MKMLLMIAVFILTVSGSVTITMDGPMTGPGQVPWDADLGIPFGWRNGTYFLEGDCMVRGTSGVRVAGNAIGGCKPLPCKVIWYLAGNGNPIQFTPITGQSTVPAGSVTVDDVVYIWMMNVVQWGPPNGGTHANSFMIAGTPTPANYAPTGVSFETDSKFVNPAPVLSPKQDQVYMYGTGLYRYSPVYLAAFDPSNIRVKSQYQYYSGNSSGKVSWSPNEAAAIPIIANVEAGEISAIWSTYLGEYVITFCDYSSGHAILWMYRSSSPVGPFSKTVLYDDAVAYPWRAGLSGFYGGYCVPDLGVSNPILFMTVSFWVPYRTYMIHIDLRQVQAGGSNLIVGLSGI